MREKIFAVLAAVFAAVVFSDSALALCPSDSQITMDDEIGFLVCPVRRLVIQHIALGGGGGTQYVRLRDGALVGKDELQDGEKYVLKDGWESEIVIENLSPFGVSFAFYLWGADGQAFTDKGFTMHSPDGSLIGSFISNNFAIGLGPARGTIRAVISNCEYLRTVLS